MMILLAQGNNNDWMQMVIPVVVFVLYSAANIMKTAADKKAKAPKPVAPAPRPPAIPADEQPRVLMEMDPAARPTNIPVKTSPQQAELERLLRELGVPKSPTSSPPRPLPPKTPQRKVNRGPRTPGAPRSPSTPKQATPKRAEDRHLKSNLEKRHTDRRDSLVEAHHLESAVANLPQHQYSAMDPAALLARQRTSEAAKSLFGQNLRQAFMFSIVLGPPIGMRDDPASTEPLM
jgi:hypothetical protein